MGIRKIILMMGMVTTIFFFTYCLRGPEQFSDPRGEDYAGSAACVSCHKNITASYTHTAHFLSTRIANGQSVAGSFSKDSNELLIDDSTRIMMEKRDSGLYQVLYVNHHEAGAHRFDLVMGAIKGQTYMYWQENKFLQLPVSYLSVLNSWTSSPGYKFTNLHFDRPVVQECFMCHSSFASGDPHGFSAYHVQQNSWVFNIDCERCHGPAAAHVRFQQTHPEEKKGVYITSFQSLTRQQKIDVCAVCHSGTKHVMMKSTFSFKMGDSLSSYVANLPNINPDLDVHGNQTQLLSQSRCFRMSMMDCTTCHNTHVDQRGMTSTFNERCQSCHSAGKHFCRIATDSNTAFLKNNCTRCHMPAQASHAIVVQMAKNTADIPTLVVNHRIGIYRKETTEILNEENLKHKIH